MADHADRLSNIEAALQGLKLVTSGMNDLVAQYPPLPKDTDKLSTHERLTALEKAHDNFRIVGGANTQVSGSLKHGFCINNSCPGEDQGQGGAINIPPAVYGACCFDDGSCSVTTQIACISAMGTYQGDGTDCDTTGACCDEMGNCTVTTEGCCTGTYQGDDTTCDPDPCTPPTGACCHDTTCDIETEDDCTGSGGTYQGDDTTCDPNPCEACLCEIPFGFLNPDDGMYYLTKNYDYSGDTCYADGYCCTPPPPDPFCPGGEYNQYYKQTAATTTLVSEVFNAEDCTGPVQNFDSVSHPFNCFCYCGGTGGCGSPLCDALCTGCHTDPNSNPEFWVACDIVTITYSDLSPCQ